MDKLPKSKKAVLVASQFVALAVIYCVVMYLLDMFFESDHRYSIGSIAVQSVVFATLYTLWSLWSERRKNKEKEGTK